MGIKPAYKMTQVRGYIKQQRDRSITSLINTYKFVGEGFVAQARSKTPAEGSFNDITGNLRSSIGYIILMDGKQLTANFQQTGGGSDKATGTAKGKTFAEEVAINFPRGIVLIVVAGMQYAAAVESRGKDVITGSSLGIETRVKTLFARLTT